MEFTCTYLTRNMVYNHRKSLIAKLTKLIMQASCGCSYCATVYQQVNNTEQKKLADVVLTLRFCTFVHLLVFYQDQEV